MARTSSTETPENKSILLALRTAKPVAFFNPHLANKSLLEVIASDHISVEDRAASIITLLDNLSIVVPWLSIGKLEHIKNKLKIISENERISRLLTNVEKNLKLKRKLCKPKSPIKSPTPTVCWNSEYESRDIFKTNEAYQGYRKTRDLISSSLKLLNSSSTTNLNSNANLQKSIKKAFSLAFENSCIMNLAWYITLSIRNTDLSLSKVDCFLMAVCSEAIDLKSETYFKSFIYSYLEESLENFDADADPAKFNYKFFHSKLLLAQFLSKLVFSTKSWSALSSTYRNSTDNSNSMAQQCYKNFDYPVRFDILSKIYETQPKIYSIPWMVIIYSAISPSIVSSSPISLRLFINVKKFMKSSEFLQILENDLPNCTEKITYQNLESDFYYDEHELKSSNALEIVSSYWRTYSLSCLDLLTSMTTRKLVKTVSQISPVYRPMVSKSSDTPLGSAMKKLDLSGPKKTSAVRRISLTSVPSSALNISVSQSFKRGSLSPRPLGDRDIELNFLKTISPSVEKAISIASERVYSNAIRDFRTNFQPEEDPIEVKNAMRYINGMIEYRSTLALEGLLPNGWSSQQRKLGKLELIFFSVDFDIKYIFSSLHLWPTRLFENTFMAGGQKAEPKRVSF